VIVNDLNIVRMTFTPTKANTPALIDADTVLTFPVA
jgi:hypothetical protein